jgi:hypothetical protein
MSQSTFAIPNQSGANYRVAVNNALQALASLYSGTTPSESYAYQLWFDTSTNILKQRNAANNAWVNLWGATLGSPVVIDFRDTRLEVHGAGNIASNTAVGQSALQVNTTGENNTAYGESALRSNTFGGNNTALGQNSLRNNISGSYNTAVGLSALQSNTSGIYNTAIGWSALISNTTGSNNTALGQGALYSNNTGVRNTAIGESALRYNNGFDNTAVGQNALFSNTTGTYNTAIGKDALYSNNTGIQNTAVGQNALYSNTTGIYNTAVGQGALYYNNTGVNNTAVGQGALLFNTSGVNNTAIGFNAGSSITTQSNQFILGNSSVASLQCQVALTVASDGRDKKDIEELSFSGLEYVNALIPRTYTWNMRPCIGNKKDVTEIGFVAQEVESVQSTVYEIPGMVTTFDIDYTDPETGEHTVTDKKMITPALLIPVLVKAIQELSQRLNALEA